MPSSTAFSRCVARAPRLPSRARLVITGLVALACALSSPAQAAVTMHMVTPHSEYRFRDGKFVTNDPELRLAGYVTSDAPTVRLDIDSPNGLPDLAETELIVDAILLDLGSSSRKVGRIEIAPVIIELDGSRYSFGPRELLASISADGSLFSPPVRLPSASGVGSPDGIARVDLPVPATGRFLLLEWVTGWQRSPDSGRPVVRVSSVSVREPSGGEVPTRVAQVRSILDTTSGRAPFALTVLLREGSNLVSVAATESSAASAGSTPGSETVTIPVTLVSALLSGAGNSAQQVVLSDGAHVSITIPSTSAPATLRRVRIVQEDAASLEVPVRVGRSYVPHRPVLLYRFEGSLQTSYRAEATASLPGQPPSLAVDGIRDFPSTWVSNLTPMPVRWRVDLERTANLGSLVIHARHDGVRSYAPQAMRILASLDGADYQPVEGRIGNAAPSSLITGFGDRQTTVAIPTGPSVRWIELVIEETKQPNNVQINEIEFYDTTGARILAQQVVPEIGFVKPVRVEMRLYDEDLSEAGVALDSDVGLFLWQRQTGEWIWSGARAERLPSSGERIVQIELGTLPRMAIVPLSPTGAPRREIDVRWSTNPFSPNGDGVADTTRLAVALPPSESGTWSEVTVQLFDTRGKLIETLADRAEVASSVLILEWDGSDRSGRPVPIGPYVYQVIARTPTLSGASRVVRNGVLVVVR
ncbi:hypothetical protein FJZ36_01775 [Candidatus Poribacteria bacterium]|nr:hypothetical protein [Candidatus Poribacteria bacterium]